jgi:hypothetical protein
MIQRVGGDRLANMFEPVIEQKHFSQEVTRTPEVIFTLAGVP